MVPAMLGLALLASQGACSTISSGSPSLDQFSLEQRYARIYHEQMTALLVDLKAYQASGSVPGACDKGSTKEACYQADQRTLADLDAFTKAIQVAQMPSRFVTADRDLKGALGLLSEGFKMRAEVIVAGIPGSSFEPANAKIQQGLTQLVQAYSEFPKDAKLDPPIS
jgi:hypothetical protein